ncbi:hypothetical protein [Streptomyces sp. SHP 1-2]|uniref:hypothetical protein n=1 Tax=Streptomyces sp. SHP 1-2 TaxID=2769489 RepID=UPI002236F04D|nr:hypothetical protein [Streptomyces sp. SHP 1-2]MCW5252231.1 hypothetical protein [Streptomyces sp. SHP 1-2]
MTAQPARPVPDEDHPTGTAWRPAHPRPAHLPAHIRPWTPEEQARHRADLDEALDGWSYSESEHRRQGGDRG